MPISFSSGAAAICKGLEGPAKKPVSLAGAIELQSPLTNCFAAVGEIHILDTRIVRHRSLLHAPEAQTPVHTPTERRGEISLSVSAPVSVEPESTRLLAITASSEWINSELPLRANG